MGVKELRQALVQHKRLFVDTNIIIYLLDNHPRYSDLATTVMETIETGKVDGIASMMTLAEALTQPARLGKVDVLRDYELYLTNFPNLTLLPVDLNVARQAAQLRGLHTMKMPDAILLATARIATADAVVTNDKDWRGKTGTAAIIVLDDFL